jgi:predicted deacylase
MLLHWHSFPVRKPGGFTCGVPSTHICVAGGVLYVLPKVAEWVRRGDVIAEITDVYGRPLHKHLSPETGIVVGKSCNPVCQTGDRILHLGIVTESFPAHQDDGHV